MRSPIRQSARIRLMLGASATAILLSAAPTLAQQSPFVRRTVDPSAAAAAQAQAQANQGAQATAAAQRSLAAFSRAAQASRTISTAQAAARAAALAGGGGGVPNGLGAGGLEVTRDLPENPLLWTNANGPTQTVGADGRTQVTIEQTDSKAVLTWDSFNVGQNTTLTFDQSAGGARASDWVALNRVTDAQASPTQILGNIEAQGKVYVINRNGVVFGGASQINVGGILASTMDLGVGKFDNSLIFETNPVVLTPALISRERDADGNLVATGDVVVDAGAQLTTANGGFVLLAGENVENNGTIRTPDGQTILAAGRAVFLGSSTDPSLRGFNVHVGPNYIPGVSLPPADPDSGGLAINTGDIFASRGNVTLTALNVTNAGRIGATNGVTANGSVILAAEDSFGGNEFEGQRNQRNGVLTLATGSLIDILPEDSVQAIADSQAFRRAEVDLSGAMVDIQRDAIILAPAGNVSVETGLSTPGGIDFSTLPSRIYVDDGALIDVSGIDDVLVSMERNSIEFKVALNELRDSPLFRDSFLYKATVSIDVREGTDILDYAGFQDNAIQRTAAERSTEGGTISLNSLGDLILREGSVLDVAGGSVRTQGGYVQSSQLIDSRGNVIDIADASPNGDYVGFYGDFIVNHARWGVQERYVSPFMRTRGRYQQGYTEGKDAGRIDLIAQNYVLDGDLFAEAYQGEYQRQARDALNDPLRENYNPSVGEFTPRDLTQTWRETTRGGELNIGQSTYKNSFMLADDVVIQNDVIAVDQGFTIDSELSAGRADTVFVSSSMITDGGFGQLSVLALDTPLISENAEPGVPAPTYTSITVADDVSLDLGAYGSLTLVGGDVSIAGDIRAAGGDVLVSGFNVALESGGKLDVAGTWTNDYQALQTGVRTGPVVLDGGSVRLNVEGTVEIGLPGFTSGMPFTETGLVLAEGSLIDVSGGAWVQSDRNLEVGDGGDIVIDTHQFYGARYDFNNPPRLVDNPSSVFLGGELRGYAYALPGTGVDASSAPTAPVGRGGSLTIETDGGLYFGDDAVLPNGVLAAGEETPGRIRLTETVELPAGTVLTSSVSVTSTSAPPGTALGQGVVPTFTDGPIEVAADWIVPDGFFAYDESFNFYGPGSVFPAGQRLGSAQGQFPTGYVVPADVFPNGLPVPEFSLAIPAGPLQTALTLPRDTLLPRGFTFDRDVLVQAPTTLSTEFLQQGGFSNFTFVSSGDVTLEAGTVLAPRTVSRVLGIDYARLETSAAAQGAASLAQLDDALRPATDLEFQLDHYSLNVPGGGFPPSPPSVDFTPAAPSFFMEEGSAILADRGGRVGVSATGSITIAGTIDAPAGEIFLNSGVVNSAIDPFAGPQTQQISLEPSRAIWLTDTAVLSARGQAQLFEDRNGFETGRVHDGGEVRIQSTGGHVVAEAGSVIDVSGIAAEIDVVDPASPAQAGFGGPVAERVTVGSRGGDVSIYSAGGAILDGTLAGGGGTETAQGGRLTLAGPIVQIRQSGDTLADGLMPGDVIDTDGTALYRVQVAADDIMAGGFADLQLSALGIGFQTPGRLEFKGEPGSTLNLTMPGDALIRAPFWTADDDLDVLIDATTVALGETLSSGGGRPSTLGTSTLEVRGDLIDVIGGQQFGYNDFSGTEYLGFANITLRSKGDIRGLRGTFQTDGDLLLEAAQIYTSTFNEPMTFRAANGTLTIRHNGGPTPTPLSAGGNLTFEGRIIDQGGYVRAPLGRLNFIATEELILSAGGVTNVSLDGNVVPFGNTLNGDKYVYGSNQSPVDAPPEKLINLQAPTITIQDGATIDLSGGGDLLATEFVPGEGGTNNYLDGSNVFAVVAGFEGDVSAYDSVVWEDYATTGVTTPGRANDAVVVGATGPRYVPGTKIYLSGGGGLPAGEYTLLPAEYALLPGGFRVTVSDESGFANPSDYSFTLQDGSTLQSGYTFRAGTPYQDSRRSTFQVSSGEVVREYSEYVETLATAFFNSDAYIDAQVAANRPITNISTLDGGRIVLNAGGALALGGTVLSQGATGGRGGSADIVGESIAIVSRDGDAAPDDGQVYQLVLGADRLSAFGVESLLIGGIRSSDDQGRTAIDATASRVVVANGADSALARPEVLLASSDLLEFREGAVVRADGEASDAAPSELVLGVPNRFGGVAGSGDGAFVRLSNLGDASVDRVGVTLDSALVLGNLVVADGVTLDGGASLTLDTARSASVSADAALSGETIAVGAGRIALGDPGADFDGVAFAGETLALLDASRNIRLRSRSTIDVYGSSTIGTVGSNGFSLDSLILETGAVVGHGDDGDVFTINAGNVTLGNPENTKFKPGEIGSGDLVFNTETFTQTGGTLELNGFSDFDVAASQGVLGVADGLLRTTANVSLATPLVTTRDGGRLLIEAAGDLTITDGGFAKSDLAGASAAGLIDLTGRNASVDTTVEARGGTIALTSAGGDLTLGVDATLDASGYDKAFNDVSVSVDAGTVSLTAQGGDLNAQAGSTIDLDGGENSDAGRLNVSAADGGLVLASDITARAGKGGLGGSATIDGLALTDVGSLLAGLNAQGFDRDLSARTRTGDVTLANTIEGRTIHVVADMGSIIVSGTLDASGPTGGAIELWAGEDLSLTSTARLLATGERRNAAGKGGSVALGAQRGQLSMPAGAVIDVGAPNALGSVLMRVSRTGEGAGSGVAVEGPIAATIRGANNADRSNIRLEAVKTYAFDGDVQLGGENADLTLRTIAEDNDAFAANLGGIRSGLGNGAIRVQAGVEVTATGDLVVAEAMDLSTLRSGGEPGVLTLRAGNDLIVRAAISDGFAGIDPDAALLTGEDSWRYRLVGGADILSADPLAIAGELELLAQFRASIAGASQDQLAAVILGPTSGVDAEQILDFLPIAGLRDRLLQLEAGEVKGLLVEDLFSGTPLSTFNQGQLNQIGGIQSFQDFLYQLDPDVYYQLYENRALSDEALKAFSAQEFSNVVNSLPGFYDLQYSDTQALYDIAVETMPTLASILGPENLLLFVGEPGYYSGLRYGQEGTFVPAGLPVAETGAFLRAYADYAFQTPNYPKSIDAINNLFNSLQLVYGTAADGERIESVVGLMPDEIARQFTLDLFDSTTVYDAPATVLTASSAELRALIDSDPAISLGSVVLEQNALVRTGTGDIDVAAGRGLYLLDPTATIYTAGTGTTDPTLGGRFHDVFRLTDGSLNDFADGGGDLTIVVRSDIQAERVQFVNEFGQTVDQGGGIAVASQRNFGLNADPTLPIVQPSWWIDYGTFQQGVGALGGGQVDIVAGGDVRELGVSIPTSGRLTIDDELVILGGGDLSMRVGGDLLGGGFTLGRGDADISAVGGIGATTFGPNPQNSSRLIGLFPLFNLGDVNLEVAAAGDIQIDDIKGQTTFSTYEDDSRASITSTGGDLIVRTTFAPGTVELAALNGDITTELVMTSSPTGTLNLLADGELLVGKIEQYRIDPEFLGPRGGAPSLIVDVTNEQFGGNVAPSASFQDGEIHVGDSVPNRLYALNGDVRQQANIDIPGFAPGQVFIHLAKATWIDAGQDIRNPNIRLVNANADDVTRLTAGRDIILSGIKNRATDIVDGVRVSGGGALQVTAGRDINLGFSDGFITDGSLRNDLMPEGGASISINLGNNGTPDYAAFMTAYLDPESSAAIDYLTEDDISGVERDAYARLMIDYVAGLTGEDAATLTPEAAYAAFQALPDYRQRPLIEAIYFNELTIGGSETNYAEPPTGVERGFGRGYAAIARLFPGAELSTEDGGPGDGPNGPRSGRLTLTDSQIATRQGGDLTIINPGGDIRLGANIFPQGALPRDADDSGLLTLFGGAINVFATDDILVRTSRLFTVAGGDITAWSTFGDINAGQGLRTVNAPPAPVFSIDPSTGFTKVDFSAGISGSGIGTFRSREGAPPANINLFAPNGEVNAGDAGIIASGNIQIAALSVVNADNIQAEGEVTGVPQTAVINTAALSAASSATAAVVEQAQQVAQRRTEPREVPTIITGRFLGFGDT